MNSLVNSITADELADTPSSVVFRRRRAAIHLRRTLPHASSNLPRYSGEQPSNASCLVLLQVGFTVTDAVTSDAVSSYLTFSPLPPAEAGGGYFLWHFPAGRPGWLLTITLLYGARTFLGTGFPATRPPGQLIRGSSIGRNHESCSCLHSEDKTPSMSGDLANLDRSGVCPLNRLLQRAQVLRHRLLDSISK